MINPTKVMLIAPAWHDPSYVGNYRIQRFVRWLSASNINIVLVRSGSDDYIRHLDWGVEVIVRDPFGFFPDNKDTSKGDSEKVQKRRPNKLRRWLAYLLFNPDPSVVWAKRVANHPLVLKHGQGVSWILSSNPPESTHVAASMLAKRLQAELIVDMRDGWLDEPLKPILKQLPWREWQEGRLERKILHQAKKIFVTSVVWQKMLEERLSFTQGKTEVLTNGYPKNYTEIEKLNVKKSESKKITLIHAGRLTSSSHVRDASIILKSVLMGIKQIDIKGNITFLGNLENQDLETLNNWQPHFQEEQWTLNSQSAVPREEVINKLTASDGLLLLSNEKARIPAKLFEYLPAQKPILAVTFENSAVWQLCNSIPQVFLVDSKHPEKCIKDIQSFLKASSSGNYDCKIPQDFSEKQLSEIFYNTLEIER